MCYHEINALLKTIFSPRLIDRTNKASAIKKYDL
jgi:hypothetical protein